ncbi:MAG: hypothetical protein JO023_28360 [Chloroflexi bacterium]|nr:hypothetical protein [Chloroflexota bacterium]
MSDFDLLAFILGNVPYGQIAVDNLLTGAIREIKAPLAWYFDGEMHTVNRAVSIPYVYTRTSTAGMAESYGDYILVGFGDNPGQSEEAIVSLAPHESDINHFLLAGKSATSLPTSDVTIRGLTRDYSAVRPYPHDFQYIAADLTLYEQLVYWFFGGKFYHLTKTVRIKNQQLGTILIGFQGPSM